MGASLSYRIYETDDIEKAKAEFVADQESDRYENGHSYSGGIGMLDGVSNKVETAEDFNEAQDWICENAEKWEEAKVVSFKDKDGNNLFMIGGWCAE